MCLMCLKPRSIPWNMTVNMAEALPQWSSDAHHPSEVCDGCTNQTHRATASPGILPLLCCADWLACCSALRWLFRIIPPSKPGIQKSKLKKKKTGGKQRGRNAKRGRSDKLWHPLNWLSDPAAVDVMIYPVLMFSLCFIPGKSLVYVSCMHPWGN